jgi:hypothetical protein
VSTPAVAGNLVFALGSDCVLRALAADTGEARWQADLRQRFGAAPRRGCESSPFVEGGRLVLQPAGAEDNRLVALDACTGELAWTAKGRERANYSSPVAADIGGVRQVVVHHIATVENAQMSGLSGFRLGDGALLWSATFERHLSVETPLVAPEGVLLLTWNDARLARVSRSGDAWTAQTVSGTTTPSSPAPARPSTALATSTASTRTTSSACARGAARWPGGSACIRVRSSWWTASSSCCPPAPVWCASSRRRPKATARRAGSRC